MSIDSDDILDKALSPERVSGDEGSVKERSVKELIEADRYTGAKQATKPPYGLRIAKTIFPGTQD